MGSLQELQDAASDVAIGFRQPDAWVSPRLIAELQTTDQPYHYVVRDSGVAAMAWHTSDGFVFVLGTRLQ